MTEVAGLGTTHAWYAENRLGSIGVALPYINVRVAAVDDASRTLATDEVGELMVKGPIVRQGYFGDKAATSQAIEPDGWLHTGDLASMDEDGYFFVVDRKKDMILTGRYNIYPAEIERVLAQQNPIKRFIDRLRDWGTRLAPRGLATSRGGGWCH